MKRKASEGGDILRCLTNFRTPPQAPGRRNSLSQPCRSPRRERPGRQRLSLFHLRRQPWTWLEALPVRLVA